jgi:hypothetical protein
MELHAVPLFYTDKGQLVELEDDVLSIVRQVREAHGDKIKVCWEPTTGEYVFSEMCDDGTERLIFTCEELDGRALERLQLADSRSRGYVDAYDRQEREQEEAFAAQDEHAAGLLRDRGERLAHALKKDGIGPYPAKIAVPQKWSS